MNIKMVVHEADEGGFWAEVPALPGCVTQAETLEELEANMRGAIQAWLEAEMPASDGRAAASDRVIELTM